MKITVLEQNENTLVYRIEREKGMYNNITEPITLNDIEGLSEDEVKTLGYIKLKPLAKRVFEVIEPLDEPDNPVDFSIIPSRTVKTDVFAPTDVYINTEASVTKQLTDQYGQATNEFVPIDTSTLGQVTVEGKTINVIEIPKPELTEVELLKNQIVEQNQAMSEFIDLVFATVPELSGV